MLPLKCHFTAVVLIYCFGSIHSKQEFPFEKLQISVSDNKLLLPVDLGLSFIASLQNSSYKIKVQEEVSEKCSVQIDWFFESLNNITDDGMWALKMIDATAKIPSGILKLNLGDWMGNFDQCLEIKSQKRSIKGKYCLGTMYIAIDDSFDFVSESLTKKAKLFSEKKGHFQNSYPTASYPSFGICIPDGCTTEDLKKVVATLDLSFPLPFECQTIDDANPPLTVRAWCVIGFFIVIMSLMTASTMYDLNCRRNNTEPAHVLLNSFSVYTNGKKIFRSSKKTSELHCLNGIRFLSMIWVIVGHTFSVTSTGPIKNALDVLEYLDTTKSMIFASAVHSVDTFLMITGLLVVYGYMKGRQSGADFNIVQFYIHRYIRLTPPFLAVILASMALLQYMGSGPHWSFIVNYFQEFCVKNWWSSLLYLQNYINVEQWCLGQTWYLNIDWQLYLFAPLFLLTLTWRPVLGTSLLSLALLIFIIVPFYVTWVNELPALVTNLYGDLMNFQNKYYLKTHTRASPWFVGALIGYFIAKLKFENKRDIRFNKFIISGIWCVVLTVIPMCIFMGHDTLRSQEYHQYQSAFYNSLVRPTWAACIGWIVFACSIGYGGFINAFLSLSIFQILNRFTYSIYLLHVTMIYMIIYASKTPAYFSFFHIAYSFWGIASLAFALSIFWVLAFESPVLVIEKYFLERHKTKTVPNTRTERNV